MSDPIRCRHVHTEGRQCGSPALRGEKLCYHHHAQRRPLARRPDTKLIRTHLPHPEDLHAVQSGIAELLRQIAMGHDDHKSLKLTLATLALASANLARIERNRRNARELDLRERALAHSKVRFAAQHPEARLSGCHSRTESASGPASDPTEAGFSGCHSRRESASGPVEEPGYPTSPETGRPTFVAVSPRLRWDLGHDEPPVTDLVHDPELGSIAPGPDPEPRPEGPIPHPTPLITPAAPGITPEENLANWNRAVAKLKPETCHLDASADPTPNPTPKQKITPYPLWNVRSTLKNTEKDLHVDHRHLLRIGQKDCAVSDPRAKGPTTYQPGPKAWVGA